MYYRDIGGVRPIGGVWPGSLKVWPGSLKVWPSILKVWPSSLKVWPDSLKVSPSRSNDSSTSYSTRAAALMGLWISVYSSSLALALPLAADG